MWTAQKLNYAASGIMPVVNGEVETLIIEP
jgi:hypothetical protein